MKVSGAESKEQRILEAAEKIFSMYGYEKATLDAIIALADVGKGTVYKYFGNKERLFYKLVEKKNAPFVKRLQAAVAGKQGIKEKLIAYFQEMIDFYYENNDLWQIIYFEMIDGRNNCRIQKVDGEHQLIPRYSQLKISEETRERVLRYLKLVEEEYLILEKIVIEAIDAKLLKPGCDEEISSRFLFFGVAMSIFNPTQPMQKMPAAAAAEIVVDRYLYGEAIGGLD
ncbi:MAG: TetR/AcrR family transcriptional regulator [Phascolarctobacterium sp.]|uniref:TetR/AcrR family transcriptional regulator n=1 Tax=Phascolarctobacterium sp. TaxID=2049039 RepID=UPI0026DBD1A9|nr:TetR/AcrR family transcriptional regulator [Phascolarctobacterium sp.]MDO4920970.1 TetR/AcrR family transcriptional regulator [Phascolarctobacterium sp.]